MITVASVIGLSATLTLGFPIQQLVLALRGNDWVNHCTEEYEKHYARDIDTCLGGAGTQWMPVVFVLSTGIVLFILYVARAREQSRHTS